MKREYTEEKHSNPMFSKLHHHHPQFHHHSQPSPPQLYHSTTTTLCPPTSEEADSHSPAHTPNPSFPPPPPLPPSSNDGATIEVSRRPRGRPPGSKNKPKPPVIITRDSSDAPSMSPYVLELPPGVDVIESTAHFCRKRNMGLCVLSGNGAVSDVTLKQPSTTPGATVTFHGRFDILSISATILPAEGGLAAAAGNGVFTLSVAGPQGQMVGGVVVGPLVSAATVYLMAATFTNPSYHRLKLHEDDNEDVDGRDDGGHEAVSGGHEAVSGGDKAVKGYNSYGQASDVIWAPTARQPPPPPPY